MIPLSALAAAAPFMGDSVYKYYSQSHRQPQSGGLITPYKAGWRPYQSQQGRGWLSSLGSFLKPMATSAAKKY